MQDVLKIGIDKLLNDIEEMDYTKIDFNAILGKTDAKGYWLDVEDHQMSQNEEQNEEETVQSTTTDDNNMYLFEGVNYRNTAQKADIDLFDRLLLNDEETSSKPSSSSKQHASERPQRRQMTEEEKAARAAKARETKERRKQEMVSNMNDHIQLRSSKKF